GSQNDAGALGQDIDHYRFTDTETLLAFHIENPRNVSACDLLYFPIGIEKGHIKLIGKHSANGALTHPHGADEKYAARIIHAGSSVQKGHIVLGSPGKSTTMQVQAG